MELLISLQSLNESYEFSTGLSQNGVSLVFGTLETTFKLH